MRKLSEAFTDRVVILVSGKVNSGKSSLLNFIASQYEFGIPQYFYLDDGHIVLTDEQFAEGATETTSRIQGVFLGSNLVFLDSPGLHSVTAANGELTRRFTDSADLVLWITSSTSPGQTHELAVLKDELARQKPLLPIISRSDYLDESQVGDDIVTEIKLKNDTDRRGQERDVANRARVGMDPSLSAMLKEPISLSALYCKKNDTHTALFSDPGMDRLFANLATCVSDAQAYKSRKARQQVLNYLERDVLGQVRDALRPKIDALIHQAQAETISLNAKRIAVHKEVMTDVLEAIPPLLTEARRTKDLGALRISLQNILSTSLNNRLQATLSPYLAAVDEVLLDLTEQDIGQLNTQTYDRRVISGSNRKAIGAAGGAAAGAGLGTLLLPGLGTLIGGGLGMYLGSKAGEALMQTRLETVVIGVSDGEVQTAILALLDDLVPAQVNQGIDNVIEVICCMQHYALGLKQHISQFETTLSTIKDAIHE